MKKLHLKLSIQELAGLSELLETELPDLLVKAATSHDRCVAATLLMWHNAKVKPKTYLATGSVGLKLDAPTAFALQAFLDDYPLEPQNQIDNMLLQLRAKIDQAYAVPSFSQPKFLPQP